MKYLYILLALQFIFGCNTETKVSNKNEYEIVADSFLNKYYKGDIEGISEYCTNEYYRRLSSINSYNGLKSDSSYKYTYLRDSIVNENKVYVLYDWKGTRKIQLKKVNSKWLVTN